MLYLRSKRLASVLCASALVLMPTATSAAPAHGMLTATILGQWAAGEKTDFLAILSYCKAHYNVDTTYQQSSGDLSAELNTRVQGGTAPDLATLSTPSSIAPYVAGGSLSPLTFVDTPKFRSQYASSWRDLGTINGKLYAIYMKADVKSIIWYSPAKFAAGHYTIPKTWNDLVTLSNKMLKDGKHPWTWGIGGTAGGPWTLADFFDNVYLMVGGPQKYDRLINHTISWTDPSVAQTFQTMNQIVGSDAMIATGGRSRALSQDWSAAAAQMVTDPTAEFYAEATFVGAGLRTNLPKDVEGKDYSSFPFPRIGNWPATPVTFGPNGVVMFHDTAGSRALIQCLVDPNALAQWAKLGGFISPNSATPASAYPDALTRENANLLVAAGKAGLLRGGADDLMPAGVGASPSGCMPVQLTKWFQNPSSYRQEMSTLESCAKKVYKH